VRLKGGEAITEYPPFQTPATPAMGIVVRAQAPPQATPAAAAITLARRAPRMAGPPRLAAAAVGQTLGAADIKAVRADRILEAAHPVLEALDRAGKTAGPEALDQTMALGVVGPAHPQLRGMAEVEAPMGSPHQTPTSRTSSELKHPMLSAP